VLLQPLGSLEGSAFCSATAATPRPSSAGRAAVRRTAEEKAWKGVLLAAGCDDATKCARVLVEAADRSCNEHRDRLGVLTAVRWRLAGVIDVQPDDLVPIVALGLAELAALEPGPRGRSPPRGHVDDGARRGNDGRRFSRRFGD
jgi:hypothetical protein